MGMNKSQSLGDGFGPDFPVLQVSSSAKARQDEVDCSDPVAQHPLHLSISGASGWLAPVLPTDG